MEGPDLQFTEAVIDNGVAGKHVDRFETVGRVGPKRFVIAVADREIIADQTPKARKAEADRIEWGVCLVLKINDQPIVFDAEEDSERPLSSTRIEAVALEQVEDGDLLFLLHIVIAPDNRSLVELDANDALVRHGPSVSPVIHTPSTQAATKKLEPPLCLSCHRA